MPASKARVTAGAIAVAGVCIAAGLYWTVASLSVPSALPPPRTRTVAIGAEVVATLKGEVRTTRRGRLLAVLAEPGERIEAGDAVFEFEDLALIDSRASLEREIAALREQSVEQPDIGLVDVRAEGQAVRRAALRHLEETYRLAQEDFGRWQSLYEQGLVARLEYEQKARAIGELEVRLDQARAAARQEPKEPIAPPKPQIPPDLRRSERLLARLAELPETFFVKSPWAGTVAAIHCGNGARASQGRAAGDSRPVRPSQGPGRCREHRHDRVTEVGLRDSGTVRVHAAEWDPRDACTIPPATAGQRLHGGRGRSRVTTVQTNAPRQNTGIYVKSNSNGTRSGCYRQEIAGR